MTRAAQADSPLRGRRGPLVLRAPGELPARRVLAELAVKLVQREAERWLASEEQGAQRQGSAEWEAVPCASSCSTVTTMEMGTAERMRRSPTVLRRLATWTLRATATMPIRITGSPAPPAAIANHPALAAQHFGFRPAVFVRLIA